MQTFSTAWHSVEDGDCSFSASSTSICCIGFGALGFWNSCCSAIVKKTDSCMSLRSNSASCPAGSSNSCLANLLACFLRELSGQQTQRRGLHIKAILEQSLDGAKSQICTELSSLNQPAVETTCALSVCSWTKHDPRR